MNRHLSLTGLIAMATSGSALAQTVPVGTIEELYAAVNDPANAGATLTLAPGVYRLSAANTSGIARPNGGRLELQQDMSLVGLVGDRSAVVIDAANLPASSYGSGVRRTAAIRMGRGRNAITWLSARNALFGTANIDTSLERPGVAYVTLAHLSSSGSQRGLDVGNFGPYGASGKMLEADVIDDDAFGSLGAVSQGIRIFNFQTGPGTVVNARLIGNRAWNNNVGSLIGNNATNGSATNVFSASNQFFGNSTGLVVFGSFSGTSFISNDNTVDIDCHGDRIVNNVKPPANYFGGIHLVAGENGSAQLLVPYLVNNNSVRASFWGCRMSGNNTWDLVGVGARSTPETIGAPGANNRLTIEMHGAPRGLGPWQPVELFAECLPNDQTLNNSVTVIR